jgi:hypothetical protein
MNVTELALALYAADLPGSNVTTPEIYALVCQGIERLGGTEAVYEKAQKLRDLNLLLLNGEIDRREHATLIGRLWPDQRRLDRCLDYAHPIGLVPGPWCAPQTACV